MQILHARIMQMQILHSTSLAKNARLFLHKREKPRKNDARAQRTQNRTQTPRNWTKNSPNTPQQVTIKLRASKIFIL